MTDIIIFLNLDSNRCLLPIFIHVNSFTLRLCLGAWINCRIGLDFGIYKIV